MLDFQAIRLLHHHGNGEYADMVERSSHGAEAHDPEREWMKGARIFACKACSDEVLVLPTAAENGEAPGHES
jgi:hypothetical protein